MNDEIMETISGTTFGVWFLIGAALVFFMQCGFAMVERTKFLSYCVYSAVISAFIPYYYFVCTPMVKRRRAVNLTF